MAGFPGEGRARERKTAVPCGGMPVSPAYKNGNGLYNLDPACGKVPVSPAPRFLRTRVRLARPRRSFSAAPFFNDPRKKKRLPFPFL
ncbi:hypothetical protein B4135_0824 [Caldibacillus debilis]|uniref:Uncharacterized protein n=1 Tax=Caldibacillus debilis TaxID=301148 RepID=A0A150M692_9BACI|nr:hypothetical protein B4135_0824 [Caldibacillus debilis]